MSKPTFVCSDYGLLSTDGILWAKKFTVCSVVRGASIEVGYTTSLTVIINFDDDVEARDAMYSALTNVLRAEQDGTE